MIGLQSLGVSQTPSTWRVLPFWALFRRRKSIGYPDEELLSVYRDYGVIPKSSRDDNHNRASDDLSAYQLVTEGSLVTNKMKAWQGSIAVSRYRGIVSPAYYVYSPISRENDQYLHYLLRSKPYIAHYQTISKGVRVNQWDLEHEALRTTPILLPPIEDQNAIADFLDRETARIDTLIDCKVRYQAALKQRAKTMCHKLVFALNDDQCERQSSGVPWLPEVPKHWMVRRCAQIFQTLDFRRIPLSAEQRANLEKTYPYYGASGQIDWVDGYLFDEDSILVGEDGANLVLQSTPIAFKATGKYWVNNHAHILKPLRGDFDYWIAALNEVPYEIYVTGSAQPKLTAVALNNIKLPVPPNEEQRVIAKQINAIQAKTSNLNDLLNKSLERLQEYRAALITAAVTGQIDVNEYKRSGSVDRHLDTL